MSRILVTGATGFVGRALVPLLRTCGHTVRAAVRRPDAVLPVGVEAVLVGEIGSLTDWRAALDGIEAVVHLAGLAHNRYRREDFPDQRHAFTEINLGGTRRLAEAAAAAGIRRMVYVSSLKAVCEGGDAALVTGATPARPGSDYGRSKLMAEDALAEVAAGSDLEAVVLRPPLVYGPGVSANFAQLLDLCRRGVPLPLASIRNQRSFLFVGNLADAIVRCLDHPGAVGGRFLLHDGTPLSTPDLLRRTAAALGRPARLLPVPVPVLDGLARLVGRLPAARRLTGSLAVDDAALREAIGWTPPFTTEDGLRITAEWFKASRGP